MNTKHIPILVVGASTIAASGALAQSGEDPGSRPVPLPAKTDPSLNRFRVGCRLSYNISAHLENVGVPSAQAFPQPPAPNDPTRRFVSATGITYQDGYVGIDSSTNRDDLTWYWGYANSDQIAGNNLLLTHSSSGPLVADFKNDPQAGLEISYARQLGERSGTKWGIETAFTYLDLDLRSGGIADPRVLAVDAFPLGIQAPPLAPYVGTYEGPGALIGDTPTRYPANIVTTVDAAVYGLKVGPYLEAPVSQRISATLGGGFTLLLADSEFRVQQSATIPVPGNPARTVSRTITDSDLGLLPAAYIQGSLAFSVSDSMTLFTGLEYESAFWTQSHGASDKRFELDLANAIFLTFGFSYSF